MKYIHKFVNETDYIVIQEYDDSRQREVSPERPAYLSWIAEGGIPIEIPYIPPEPPPLDVVKKQKQEAIGAECIARLMAYLGRDDVFSVLFDFDYFNSKAAKLNTKKAIKGEDLTADELILLTQLETNETACNALRERSDALKAYIATLTTNAEVEAVTWDTVIS